MNVIEEAALEIAKTLIGSFVADCQTQIPGAEAKLRRGLEGLIRGMDIAIQAFKEREKSLPPSTS